MKRPQKHLVHYTKSVKSVVSILENGLLLIPNRRQLIRDLVDGPFEDCEPQEFGMVSFTEIQIERAQEHKEVFGDFGIGVNWDWAARHNAQRVIYLTKEGPVFQALQSMFRMAKANLESCILFPEDTALLKAYTNRAMAGIQGARLWADLLTLYEYMESADNSSQIEWRIVQKYPFHFSNSDKASMIEEALAISKTWRFTSVKVSPDDLTMIVCPAEAEDSLRSVLPEQFLGTRILPV